jgi:hypothetical protein
MDYFKFTVTQEQEEEIRANPKLVAVTQFINMFHNVLGIHPSAQYQVFFQAPADSSPSDPYK